MDGSLSLRDMRINGCEAFTILAALLTLVSRYKFTQCLPVFDTSNQSQEGYNQSSQVDKSPWLPNVLPVIHRKKLVKDPDSISDTIRSLFLKWSQNPTKFTPPLPLRAPILC